MHEQEMGLKKPTLLAASMRSKLLFWFPRPESIVEAEKVDLYNTQAFRSPGAIVPYGALFYVG